MFKVFNNQRVNLFIKTATAVLMALLFVMILANTRGVFAQFNPEINYQGRLLGNDGEAVNDGSQDAVFRLYTAASGGSAIWTESHTGANQIVTRDGLFSVMLGSISSLTGVDFNQTLYLGVTIGSDSEMSPRKVIGTVPAAFVSGNSMALDGATSTQFLRSDEPDEMVASSTGSVLTIRQNGSGAVASFFSGANEVLSILNNGNVGIGTTSPTSRLTVAGDIALTGTIRDSFGGSGVWGQVLGSNGAGGLAWIGAELANLMDTSISSPSSGQLLSWNGSAWANVATSTLGLGGGGSLFTQSGGLTYLTSLSDNLAIGSNSRFNTSARLNVTGGIATNQNTGFYIGDIQALRVYGEDNIYVGTQANNIDSFAAYNTATGLNALSSVTDAYSNSAFGTFALSGLVSGYGNSAFGLGALSSVTSGDSNTAVGSGSLNELSSGDQNVAIGYGAGTALSTGNRNIIIGTEADVPNASGNNQLSIGNLIYGTGLTGSVGAGNIGIGTNTPTSKLSVAGDFSLTGALRDSDGNAGTAGQFLSSTGAGTEWVTAGGGSQREFINGTTTTAAGTTAKVVTAGDGSRQPVAGDFYLITYSGVAQTANNATLNINGSGVRNVRVANANAASTVHSTAANGTLMYYFDGSAYHLVGSQTNTTYAEISETNIINSGSSATGLITGRRFYYGLAQLAVLQSGNQSISGQKTFTDLLTANSLSLTGVLRDGTNAAGTNGQVLLSTGSGTQWVSTSTLGLGGGGSLFTQSGGLTYLTSLSQNLAVGTTTIINQDLQWWQSNPRLSVVGNIAVDYDSGYYIAGRQMLRLYEGPYLGYSNLYIGTHAQNIDTAVAFNNTAIGNAALQNITTGQGNLAFGAFALAGLTTGGGNLAVGSNSLQGVTSGGDNLALGAGAGTNIISSDGGTFIGNSAGHHLTSAHGTVLIGRGAGHYATVAAALTVIGSEAGMQITTGGENTLIGYRAGGGPSWMGWGITSGSRNIAIGYEAMVASATSSNQLSIGNLIYGTGLDGIGHGVSSGNIGIGTNTPTSKLSVAGDFSLTGAFRDSDGNAGTAGQVLSSTGSGTLWVTGGGGGGSSTLAGLTDVGVTSPSSGQVLSWNGTSWVNVNPGSASILDAHNNIPIGGGALNSVTSNTTYNIALGQDALYDLNNGTQNIAFGQDAFGYMYAGNSNIGIGHGAGASMGSGDSNIAIGVNAQLASSSGSNQLSIGNLIYGTGLDGRGAGISSGNIGIGTNAPAYRLSVAGDFFASGAIRDSAGNAGTSGQILSSTGTGTQWVTGGGGGGGSLFTESGSLTYLTNLSQNLAVGTSTAFSSFFGTSRLSVGGGIGLAQGHVYTLDKQFVVDTLDMWGGQTRLLNIRDNDDVNGWGISIGPGALSSGNLTYNIAIGANTLSNWNLTGERNIAIGDGAGRHITTGQNNILMGSNFAGTNLTTGGGNTFIGFGAGHHNTENYSNTFIGHGTGMHNRGGNSNVFMGSYAGDRFATTSSSVLIGVNAGSNGNNEFFEANNLIIIGADAANSMETGAHNNTLIGQQVASNLTSGNSNIMIGMRAGGGPSWLGWTGVTTGGRNIIIGYEAMVASATSSNQLSIGNLIYGTGLDGIGHGVSSGNIGIGQVAPNTKLHIGSSAITDGTNLLTLQDINSVCVFNANSGSPTCGSDQTLKKDIKTIEGELDIILGLEPKFWRFKSDDSRDDNTLRSGFIAQEVEIVLPELVSENTWIDGSQKKFLNISGMIPYIVGAVKELWEEVMLNRSRIEELERRVQQLESRNGGGNSGGGSGVVTPPPNKPPVTPPVKPPVKDDGEEKDPEPVVEETPATPSVPEAGGGAENEEGGANEGGN